MLTARLILVLAGLSLATLYLPVGRVQAQDESTDSRSIETVLKRKAEEVKSNPLSPSFVALNDEALGLTEEQSALARRVQDECRAVIAAWLTRGLDREPRPPLTELRQRLGEGLERVRSEISAQAEALVRGAVITPGQVRRWRAKAESAAPARVVERYGWAEEVVEIQEWEARDLKEAISLHARSYRGKRTPGSPLFLSLLGPKVLGTPARTWHGASDEQVLLADRVDQLARDLMRSWIERGLQTQIQPKEEEHMERILQRRRIQAAVVAHAEAILLTAVLEPEQAKDFLRYHWARVGIESLRDPELAGILRLTRDQLQEISRRLEVRREAVSYPATVLHNDGLPPEVKFFQNGPDGGMEAFAAWLKSLKEEAKHMTKRADYDVLQVLTKSQVKELARLLEGAVPDTSEPQK